MERLKAFSVEKFTLDGTCATKQIEWDSKDTDVTNSCPRKVQIKLVCDILQK